MNYRWMLIVAVLMAAPAWADVAKIKNLNIPPEMVQKDAAASAVQVNDPAAEVDRLIKLRERIYATNATLGTALDSARKNQTFKHYAFRYVCTAADNSEIDFVTGAISECKGPTLCSVRSAYESARGSCQTGKFTDLCVSSNMCGGGTVCNVGAQRCCAPGDESCSRQSSR